MNRGDRREPIFLDEVDRRRFFDTLGEACAKTRWQVHAWCLMPNHFHLVVETPEPNLVAGMKWFLGTYTARFNRRHNLSGHLFSGRYKSLMLDGSGSGYLRTVCDYVHLNPVRANLLPPGRPLRDYRWSSYAEYLKTPAQRPPWLRVDRLLGDLRIPRDSPAGRAEFERLVENRRAQEADAPSDLGPLRHGWCLGDEAFRQELLDQVQTCRPGSHRAEEREESSKHRARRLLAEELAKLGWDASQLARRRKADPEKVRIACRLRAETPMTLDWIAHHLQMGTAGHVANQLRALETNGKAKGL